MSGSGKFGTDLSALSAPEFITDLTHLFYPKAEAKTSPVSEGRPRLVGADLNPLICHCERSEAIQIATVRLIRPRNDRMWLLDKPGLFPLHPINPQIINHHGQADHFPLGYDLGSVGVGQLG